jgi:DNA repair protein RecO (recombination protein O)
LTEFVLNAVNLKSSDYQENDEILTLFSYENGIVSARAKGVKKARAKLKFASEPFCFGKYALCRGKGGAVLCGCEYEELFYGLRENIDKFYAASAAAEYCMLFVQENQPETQIFKLFLNCLNALCYGNARTENILLYFLINALKCSGYSIEFDKCRLCGGAIEKSVRFDLGGGGFICSSCGGSGGNIAAYKALKFISGTPLDRLNTINISKEHILFALRSINAFIEDICGKKLRSIEVMV